MNSYLIIFLCSSLALSTSARFVNLDGVSYMEQNADSKILGGISSLQSVFQHEFTEFKMKYNKTYKSNAEEETRFANFIYSIIRINDHNELYNIGKKTYKMSLNHMSDWSHEERDELNGVEISNSTGSLYLSSSIKTNLPESVDWREKGAVTEVKQQRQCGSCWAFSATGALEGQVWKKTGKLISLSEQQIVDCDMNGDSCRGGNPASAFNYVRNAGGIESEEDYPYISQSGDEQRHKCEFKKENVITTDTGFVQLPSGDEEKLREAVATIGPISIAITAVPSFSYYNSGIFHDDTCGSKRINHAVLLVGYGTDGVTGTPYWIIKNSWGPEWGENGYFRLERNVNSCHVSAFAVYPLL